MGGRVVRGKEVGTAGKAAVHQVAATRTRRTRRWDRGRAQSTCGRGGARGGRGEGGCAKQVPSRAPPCGAYVPAALPSRATQQLDRGCRAPSAPGSRHRPGLPPATAPRRAPSRGAGGARARVSRAPLETQPEACIPLGGSCETAGTAARLAALGVPGGVADKRSQGTGACLKCEKQVTSSGRRLHIHHPE